jgi:flagellar biosynthesis protein FlhA
MNTSIREKSGILNNPVLRMFSQNTDVFLAIGVMLVLALMILPMPPFFLDILLTANITLAILILMVSMYIKSPLELSVFPGLLLIITIFRLSLNIASTRLILGQAYAGNVIDAFGSFVVQSNYVVGFILFLILVMIQFVVIVKGSGRIAEVSARFTLDAMPGKQMAIDADMNAGLIDEREARERRAQIAREAEFYGAMDGASKFVKGDAIAGLLINIVNILGGFIIGMAQRGFSLEESIRTYTLLTVGDGLVTQIPALIVATGAGLVVTRSAAGNQLDIEMRSQIFGHPKALMLAGGALFLLAIVPGMPTFSFLFLAVAAFGLGYSKSRKAKTVKQPDETEMLKKIPAEEKIEDYLQVDPIELEIGYSLISLVDEDQGGDLFNRITNIRKQLAIQLGIIIPPVRVRDNLQLDPAQYIIKIRGNVIARDTLMMDRLLAMSAGSGEQNVEGIAAVEPAFGLQGRWIQHQQREEAELAGYTVVEPSAVLSTHLHEVLKQNADKILGRQDTKKLIDNIKREYPAVVEELNNDVLPTGTIQKVLQNLLKEGIPIRDLVTILEALLDYSRVTKNVDVLTEYVRHSLSETIASLYRDQNGILRGIAMEPKLEEIISNALQNQRENNPSLGLSPDVIKGINASLTEHMETAIVQGVRPVVLCAATIRPYFYRLIHTTFPNVAVISFTEIPPELEVEFIGQLEIAYAH